MRKLFLVLITLISPIFLICGEDAGPNSKDLHQKIERFSRHEGYEIAASLKNHSEWINLACVIQGIQDYMAGTPDKQKEEGVSYCSIIVQMFEQSAKSNLEKAQSFLQTLQKKPQFHSLEDGKVWYEILTEGKEKKYVQKDSSPLLHYSIMLLDDTPFVDTRREGKPCKVPLAETITGFAKGVEGMCVGERRKIYIHPALGYGKIGYVPPNSLLIVDVEVINVIA
jgi:FKBP-type peptidyl-prolyl cis-trans isomerase